MIHGLLLDLDGTLINQDDKKIGYITSGTFSPSLNEGIGIAYLDSKYFNNKNDVFINIRNKKIKIDAVKLPFLKN